MHCPRCIDSSLVPHMHGMIEVDVCASCNGVWLDRGELDKLAAPPAPLQDDVPEADRPGDRPQDSPPSQDHHRDDDDDWDDDDDDDDDGDDDDRRGTRSKGKKKHNTDDSRRAKRKKRFGDRLADVLDDVLDFDFLDAVFD